MGCGAGNTVFPLLELNPAARVYACDFAESGVALVRAHPAYAPAAAQGRLHAFVADITGGWSAGGEGRGVGGPGVEETSWFQSEEPVLIEHNGVEGAWCRSAQRTITTAAGRRQPPCAALW